jgi:hypothetical protein
VSAIPALPLSPAAHRLGLRFLCPRCGIQSSHPEDFLQGYCGRCHDFTGPPGWAVIKGAFALARGVLIFAGTASEHLDVMVRRMWPHCARDAQAVLNEFFRHLRDPDAAYQDPSFPERVCDHCGQSYRGPAVYCSFPCALADVA